ncbi:MAG: ATP-binding protein [Armatimonadota bacterium]|nr:ATP-binding protein [Armatimonadota bacterium]
MRASIAAGLTVGFAAVLLPVTASAVLALVTVPRLVDAVTRFQQETLRRLSVLEDVRLLITDAVSQDHAYILSDGQDLYDEAFEARIEELDRLLEVYGAGGPPETERVADQQRLLREAVARLSAAHDHVEELIVQGRLPEARHISARDGQAAARAALSAVAQLVQAEREQTGRVLERIAADARRVHRWILLAAGVAALIGGGVAASVIRSITEPVRRLVEVTRRVDRGNLRPRAGLRGSDEIAQLGASFDRMIDRLQAAFAEQERFLADISHELRTPITVVRGHLELLRRSDRPDQRERAVRLGLDELSRMTRLVDDLLLLARAARPDFLAVRPVHLPGFVDEVFQKARALADRSWHRGPVPDVTLMADPDRLTQALLNLLRNAAQHTRPGQRITLSASVAGEWVTLAVADEGEGIPADLLPRLFERFHRGAGRSDGTGLGLSIVRAIARAHGGDVTVHSTPGAGSTFTLRLPRAAPGPPTVTPP